MPVLVPQRFRAQNKTVVFIDLTGKQAVEWTAELDETVEIQLRDDRGLAVGRGAAIDDAAVVVVALLDFDRETFIVRYGLADVVDHPAQRCVVGGVNAAFTGSGKTQRHAPVFILDDDAETQFGFGVTDPALTGFECRNSHR